MAALSRDCDDKLAATAQLHAVSDAAGAVLHHTALGLATYLQVKHPRLSLLRQLSSHLQADLEAADAAHARLHQRCSQYLTSEFSDSQ